MNKVLTVLTLLMFSGIRLFPQVAINSDNSPPDPSAGLDIKFTNKGLLIPRMTQNQIRQIATPSNGLEVFNTDDGKMYIYAGSDNLWKDVAYGPGFLVPAACGYSITKSHAAGTVAPVSKTVTYVTVTGVPGEPNKCWITSNLGADHQAGSVSDLTEPSAGWYWQFNRKQGFMATGNGHEPPAWNATNDNTSATWEAAKDPCVIELGNAWRIPTNSEWINADAGGNWTNWTGPWNSVLKLHAAGYLSNTDGSLFDRGNYGGYWSNAQSSATNGWYLGFQSPYCNMTNNYKGYGFSVRCIRSF